LDALMNRIRMAIEGTKGTSTWRLLGAWRRLIEMREAPP
jgi:hypothetical protein